jgi:hypothetical protein
MNHIRRRSRREAIAMVFATDLNTFAPYQPGRTRVPVYTEGCSYYCAVRRGERAPESFGEWKQAGTVGDYSIMIAEAQS